MILGPGECPLQGLTPWGVGTIGFACVCGWPVHTATKVPWGHGGGGSTGPAAVFGELVTGRVNQRTFLFCFWSVGDSESSVPSSVQDRMQVTGMPEGQLQS